METRDRMSVLRKAPSETLRAAIILDGRPMRQIAAEASVPASTISRFINRRRYLSPRSFDRVAGVVGVELRPVARSA
jgi:plasmid maintenance system antidote protein VapI